MVRGDCVAALDVAVPIDLSSNWNTFQLGIYSSAFWDWIFSAEIFALYLLPDFYWGSLISLQAMWNFFQFLPCYLDGYLRYAWSMFMSWALCIGTTLAWLPWSFSFDW